MGLQAAHRNPTLRACGQGLHLCSRFIEGLLLLNVTCGSTWSSLWVYNLMINLICICLAEASMQGKPAPLQVRTFCVQGFLQQVIGVCLAAGWLVRGVHQAAFASFAHSHQPQLSIIIGTFAQCWEPHQVLLKGSCKTHIAAGVTTWRWKEEAPEPFVYFSGKRRERKRANRLNSCEKNHNNQGSQKKKETLKATPWGSGCSAASSGRRYRRIPLPVAKPAPAPGTAGEGVCWAAWQDIIINRYPVYTYTYDIWYN